MSKQVTPQNSKQGSSSNNKTTNSSTKQASSSGKQSTNPSTKQDKMAGRPLTRAAQKQERRREEQLRREQEQRRAAQRRGLLIGSGIVAVILALAFSLYFYVSAHSQPSQNQNQASQTETVFNSAYPPVDNVYCDQLEQTAVHYHAHVSIFIDGNAVQIPKNLGIASDQSCYYWLHTHDVTGIIHIEAPKNRSFTLGNILDIWSTQFIQLGYRNELSSSAGWVVYVDGKLYNGDFHNITLQKHTLITLAYNSPNVKPDTTYNWNGL